MTLLLSLLLAGWNMFLHPFFVSVVDINHNAEQAALETSIRIFTDDFENTLRQRFPGKKIDLYRFDAGGQTDSLIFRYLKEKLAVSVNGKPMVWNYVGSERVEESIWCYLEAGGVRKVESIQISNRILYEYKKEQINMHHIVVNGQRKSLKLNYPETEARVSFQ